MVSRGGSKVDTNSASGRTCEDDSVAIPGTSGVNSSDGSTILAEATREQGVVKSFNRTKGYGFIRLPSQGEDVYFKTEDLTPRSLRSMQQNSRINGASISCAPEAFREGRWRARFVRFVDEAVAKESEICARDNEAVKETVPEVTDNSPSINVVRPVRAVPKSKAAARPRGWGVPSGAEYNSRRAQLMDMGFTEEAAQEALASDIDFNRALDKLLSSGQLGTIQHKKSQPDNLIAKSEHDDDSVDHTNAFGVADISTEAGSEEPEQDLDTPAAGNSTDWQMVLGARETVLPVATGVGLPSLRPMGSVSQDICSATEAVLPIVRDISPETAKADSESTRQFARVLRSWPEDDSLSNQAVSSQLRARSGSLIQLWPGTTTELGWVYAERLNGGDSAGWIPLNVLTLLPPGYQWRRVLKSCQAFTESHLAAEQGSVLLVDASNITEKGWSYVEQLDGSRAGWFPSCALEPLPAGLLWMRATRFQDAQYETQVSVLEDALLLVDPETRTKEGWAYAWATDRPDSSKSSAQSGWVPENCLEWPSEVLGNHAEAAA